MSDDPILAALARVEAGQAAIRTDLLDELDKTRGTIMTKVEGLQDGLAAIREDMRALQEQVSSIWRELKGDDP
jgi:hypothetical protein